MDLYKKGTEGTFIVLHNEKDAEDALFYLKLYKHEVQGVIKNSKGFPQAFFVWNPDHNRELIIAHHTNYQLDGWDKNAYYFVDWSDDLNYNHLTPDRAIEEIEANLKKLEHKLK